MRSDTTSKVDKYSLAHTSDRYTLIINLISFCCLFNVFFVISFISFSLPFFFFPPLWRALPPGSPSCTWEHTPAPALAGVQRRVSEDSPNLTGQTSPFELRTPISACLWGASSCTSHRHLKSNHFTVTLKTFLPRLPSRIPICLFPKADMLRPHQIHTLLHSWAAVRPIPTASTT